MFLAGFTCGHRRQRKGPPRESGAGVQDMENTTRPSGSHSLTDTGNKKSPAEAGPVSPIRVCAGFGPSPPVNEPTGPGWSLAFPNPANQPLP